MNLSACNSSSTPAKTKYTGSAAHNAAAAQHHISGNIVFAGNVPIPADAIVTIKFVDVSLMDAAEKVLGRQEKTGVTSFPVPFKIPHDVQQLIPGMRYGVSARIEQGGKLLFINDTHIPVTNAHMEGSSKAITLPVIKVE